MILTMVVEGHSIVLNGTPIFGFRVCCVLVNFRTKHPYSLRTLKSDGRTKPETPPKGRRRMRLSAPV